ncbi:MAG TPA: DNA-binding response regulator, partial [Roseiflexaceae bacterium]|nr:DNA-binding response regulator [Roseiflexaceae bacterium]
VDTASETALLLVSAHAELDRAVSEFAMQRGFHIRHLRSADDLERLPPSVIPVALAWDVDYSRPEDWSIIQALRRQPALAQLPFVMFQGADAVASDERGPELAANGSVLIVDDDPESRELYHRLIERALPGYRIHLAPDGRAALVMLAELQPALVVLDLVMPGVDGFGVLEAMRVDERLAMVPVVVVSGHTPTFEQLARLNYPLVTYQSKGILSDDESAAFLRRSLSTGAALATPTSALVKRAIAYLQEHYARELSRQELAEAIGISQNYLSEIFHREIGMPPWEYLNRYRIKLARDLLRRSNDSITSIAGRVGFDDAAYFSRVFRRVTGRSPRAYRDRH